MKIIVDTNIVFSTLLNSNNTIGDLLLNSANTFEFYSCQYLWNEINKHRRKLIHFSKLSENILKEIEYLIFNEVTFISEEQIPKEYLLFAIDLVKDIDSKDIIFIALTEYFNTKLWTGDKKLIQGLKTKGYENILTTEDMVNLRFYMESKDSK